MKLLILAVLLLPASAWAKPHLCTPKSTELCTPGKTVKDKIMESVYAGISARGAMKSAEMKLQAEKELAAQAASYDDRMVHAQAQKEAWDTVETQRIVMEGSFKKAIELTQSSYHVGPAATSGPLARPGDPDGVGDWATGLTAIWHPAFSDDRNPIFEDFYDAKVGGSEGWHFFSTVGYDLTTIGGVTFPDGDVRILPGTFTEAAMLDNPGVLAGALYHEAQHFEEKVGRGETSIEEEEVRAYKAELAAADIFDYSTDNAPKNDGIRATIRGAISRNLALLSSRQRTWSYPIPEEEKENLRLAMELQQAKWDLKKEYDALSKEVAQFNSPTSVIARLAKKACDDADSLSEKDWQPIVDLDPNTPLGNFPAQEESGNPARDKGAGGIFERVKMLVANGKTQYRLGFLRRMGNECQCAMHPGVRETLRELALKECANPASTSAEDLARQLAQVGFPDGRDCEWDSDGAATGQNDFYPHDCPHEFYYALNVLNHKRQGIEYGWLGKAAAWYKREYTPHPPSTPSPPPSSGGGVGSEDSPNSGGGCLKPNPDTGIIGCPPK